VKANTAEHATNIAVGKIFIPCVKSITKGHANQLPSYSHHRASLPMASSDTNSKQSPSYVYPHQETSDLPDIQGIKVYPAQFED